MARERIPGGAAAAGVVLLVVLLAACSGRNAGSAVAMAAPPKDSSSASTPGDTLRLSPSEYAQYRVAPVGERVFSVVREAVGTIDFDEDMSVPVFPPVAGKIITLFARAGDDVRRGAPLYTIDSPDLAQAESNLIAAAAALTVAQSSLERARQQYEAQAIARKDLDQAVSDEQTAEGALRAARNALRVFGKTGEQADSIIANRQIDPTLLVPSPIAGRVTLRNAAPGLLAQPGASPAPVTVADVSSMWMLANVAETDFPDLHLHEQVDIRVSAWPDRVFRGRIVNIGSAVDPTTHRILVRSEIIDPGHQLRPGMFATYVIHTGREERSPAVPINAVVREGDGTMTVWVAAAGRLLIKRTVRIGLQQDGFDQIVDGLRVGDSVATEGALFLSNALTAASR